MRLHVLGRGNRAAVCLAAVLAVLAVGCSHPAGTPRASVKSCVEFGVTAVRHHVTVTTLPPACQGLTKAQIDFAVGSALHSAAIGTRGKAAQRKRIAEASHYLAQLATSVPRQRGQQPVASPAAGQAGTTVPGLMALLAWVITIAFGLRMMARWFIRRRRHPTASRFRRPPALNFAHLGLAVIGLLVWIAFLATGLAGLAWAGCALVVLATGLGMALVFLPFAVSRPERVPAGPRPAPAAGDPVPGGAPRRRRTPVISLGGHIIFATVTILLTFLAATGAG